MPDTNNKRKYVDLNADPATMTLEELLEAHEEIRKILSDIIWQIKSRQMTGHNHCNPCD